MSEGVSVDTEMCCPKKKKKLEVTKLRKKL